MRLGARRVLSPNCPRRFLDRFVRLWSAMAIRLTIICFARATALAAAILIACLARAEPPTPSPSPDAKGLKETELRGVEDTLKASEEQRRKIEADVEALKVDRA